MREKQIIPLSQCQFISFFLRRKSHIIYNKMGAVKDNKTDSCDHLTNSFPIAVSMLSKGETIGKPI